MAINIRKNAFGRTAARDNALVANMPSYVLRGLASNDLNALPAAFRALSKV